MFWLLIHVKKPKFLCREQDIFTQLCSKERSSRAIRFVFKLLTDLHWYDSIGWFNNRMGTSVDDDARKPITERKLRTGSHVQSFPRPFLSSIDVSVRLLNQLLLCYVSWSKMSALINVFILTKCRGENYPRKMLSTRIIMNCEIT